MNFIMDMGEQISRLPEGATFCKASAKDACVFCRATATSTKLPLHKARAEEARLLCRATATSKKLTLRKYNVATVWEQRYYRVQRKLASARRDWALTAQKFTPNLLVNLLRIS